MEKRQARRNQEQYKAILIILLSIIVIVSTIAAAVTGFKGKISSGGSSNSVSGNITVEENEEDKAQTEEAINALVRQYRAALASADIDTIKKLYQVEQVQNEDTITATSRVITGYLNTKCYIRNGLEEGQKVVFIYDDLQIADVDVLVPNLSYIYVRRAPDGTYYIDPGTYNEETMMYEYSKDILDYVNELSSDPEISGLYEDVNSKFEQACKDNQQLSDFMTKLNETTALHSPSEAESGTDTQASTEAESGTDTQTSSEAESGSNTQSSSGAEQTGETGESQSDSESQS